MTKKALYYRGADNDEVICLLCPHSCRLKPREVGFCRVRRNRRGELQTVIYSEVSSAAMDPIEKKPLYHFKPGSRVLSVGTVGCNLRCDFCQNFEISMPEKVFGYDMEPEEVVNLAINGGAPGIAYTYTEPTVFYEFALDTMKLAKKAGLYNVWVSNGYTNPEPARKAARYLDAINVDLKGDMKFYQRLCKVPGEEPMHKALRVYKVL